MSRLRLLLIYIMSLIFLNCHTKYPSSTPHPNHDLVDENSALELKKQIQSLKEIDKIHIYDQSKNDLTISQKENDLNSDLSVLSVLDTITSFTGAAKIESFEDASVHSKEKIRTFSLTPSESNLNKEDDNNFIDEEFYYKKIGIESINNFESNTEYEISKNLIFNDYEESKDLDNSTIIVNKISTFDDSYFSNFKDDLLIAFDKEDPPDYFKTLDMNDTSKSFNEINEINIIINEIKTKGDIKLLRISQEDGIQNAHDHTLLTATSTELRSFQNELAQNSQSDIEIKIERIDQNITKIFQKITENRDNHTIKDEAHQLELNSELKEKNLQKIKLVWVSKAIELARDFPPVAFINISGKNFYVSKILTIEGKRDYAILYTNDKENNIVARLIYHSKSDGSWRVAPHITNTGQLSKGARIHYTQETKPHLSIIAMLDDLNLRSLKKLIEKSFLNQFRLDFYLDAASTTLFKQNVSAKIFSHETEVATQVIRDCSPGVCFGGEALFGEDISSLKSQIESLLDSINIALNSSQLEGFVPNFSSPPIAIHTLQHSFFGRVEIEVYEGTLDGETIEWHMASEKNGRIWIDRIIDPRSPMSNYGVNSEFINSGILTSKPLEYPDQAWKLRGHEFEDGQIGVVEFSHPEKQLNYLDISAFLDQLTPISDYRRAKGIIKTIQ